MSTYAQIEDVEERWGQPVPPDRYPWVQTLLDEAEGELALVAGDIAARVTAEVTTAERVRVAVCAMVLRVLRNPSGFRQQSVGPFSATADRSVASGRLVVTRRERRLLGLAAGGTSVSLSAADAALRHPFRRVTDWDRWRDTILPLP